MQKVNDDPNFNLFHALRNTHPNVWGTFNTATGP
jgi:hypothetical protein